MREREILFVFACDFFLKKFYGFEWFRCVEVKNKL
jgi:hypothetical protein